ncbi:MAG TPA: metallophosphoesterase [Nitrososphaeraceae archaeon]|nr:metallophosphoesterase [Nitrososphaeraceae archaeon]
MPLEIKWKEFFKFSFIFSISLFLLCLQILTFQDVFSTTNKSLKSTNESSLTTSIKKDFTNINNTNTDNSNSINQNQTINEQKIKIVAAGDFGCRPVAQNNMKQIEMQKPDIFLALGDLTYEPTADCWYDMTNALDSKTKIAIGNHEDEEEKAKGGSKELKDSLLEHYDLQNSYYSFDYGNVHFLVLDTQLEFSLNVFQAFQEEEKENNNNKDNESDKPDAKYSTTTLKDLLAKYNITGGEIPPRYLLNDEVIVEGIPIDSEQYKFAVNDLEKANNSSSIDWIIVMFHKPFYSSLTSHIQEYIMREKYQPVFDKYGVDIVLQGHNHIYDRTLPLQFNPHNISKPIVDESINTTDKFFNPEGSIFSVVGLGGRSSHIFLNQPEYVVKQSNEFGFLTIEINGKELDAKYYDIGYKCKEEILKESDLEEENFNIFDMSSCKNDKSKSKDSLEIIDHYTISKIS